jgi:serine/threonine-protein kinase
MAKDLSPQPDLPPTADMRILDPLTEPESLLRTYHKAPGRPATLRVPPPPAEELCWNARYRILGRLGYGAQGVVYLAERQGVDGYSTRVALKMFHRDGSGSMDEYLTEMRRVALQAQRISGIQHDNLVSIRDFVALGETRVMVLEWVDGRDLARLVDVREHERLRSRLPRRQWDRLNDVIVTTGKDQCRLKPGIAVDVIRGCLAGLSALHHRGIVHCDIKPSNIMIKRAGTKKIIDVDSSSIPIEDPPIVRGTPYYMAPEQLRAQAVQLRSDIASLGYVLVELLTGSLIFKECDSVQKLLEAKIRLPGRLEQILPAEVRRDALLSGLIQKMIAIEPRNRFPDADAADLDSGGAVSFHRHLVKTDLSTEYDRELAWWLEVLAANDPVPVKASA